ncbi:hypothetical protein Trydic_g17018 [Trypoxylus dichotomus]
MYKRVIRFRPKTLSLMAIVAAVMEDHTKKVFDVVTTTAAAKQHGSLPPDDLCDPPPRTMLSLRPPRGNSSLFPADATVHIAVGGGGGPGGLERNQRHDGKEGTKSSSGGKVKRRCSGMVGGVCK